MATSWKGKAIQASGDRGNIFSKKGKSRIRSRKRIADRFQSNGSSFTRVIDPVGGFAAEFSDFSLRSNRMS
jgi:hypothetical protein